MEVYSFHSTYMYVCDYVYYLTVARLLDMVRESFGADAARNVMAVEPDNLPIILIVFKSKGKVEVRNVIQGVCVCMCVCCVVPSSVTVFYSELHR